jgi:hypothetical protein
MAWVMYFGILTQVMYIWHSTCHISSAGAFLSELPLLRCSYAFDAPVLRTISSCGNVLWDYHCTGLLKAAAQMYIWHSTCHISSAGAFLSELPLLRAQYSGNLIEHSSTPHYQFMWECSMRLPLYWALKSGSSERKAPAHRTFPHELIVRSTGASNA